MRIDSPKFSGSITQASSAYSELSGSFTGSFSGSFIGEITGSSAQFDDVIIKNTLNIGSDNEPNTINIINTGSMDVAGSINLTKGNSFKVDDVDVLDSALAFSIALG